MSQKDNILSVQWIKRDGELVPRNVGQHAIYDEFVKALEEGQVVNGFYEAYNSSGTYLQLSKIHPCIRKLAQEIGNTFPEMKSIVKKETGLVDGEGNLKSFGDCSSEELGLVIETIIQIGDHVNINFRGRLPAAQQEG